MDVFKQRLRELMDASDKGDGVALQTLGEATIIDDYKEGKFGRVQYEALCKTYWCFYQEWHDSQVNEGILPDAFGVRRKRT